MAGERGLEGAAPLREGDEEGVRDEEDEFRSRVRGLEKEEEVGVVEEAVGVVGDEVEPVHEEARETALRSTAAALASVCPMPTRAGTVI